MMTREQDYPRPSNVFQLQGGNVKVWIEQEAIHMKVADRTDPVELTSAEARELAATLIEMAGRTAPPM
jgi:hypothetical protein